jgi:exopolyphosphatase/pppGpp-phosphohydrolase
VLDVGTNTVHLLVVDAHRGAHPAPTTSDETRLRLTERFDSAGALAAAGSDALVRAVERGGAGAAEAAMRALRVPQLEICPWVLHEGVILRKLDTLDGTAQIDRSAQDAPERLGRLTTYEARCTG